MPEEIKDNWFGAIILVIFLLIGVVSTLVFKMKDDIPLEKKAEEFIEESDSLERYLNPYEE